VPQRSIGALARTFDEYRRPTAVAHSMVNGAKVLWSMMLDAVDSLDDGQAVCRACGACCSFSPDWPRFSTESDAELDQIPAFLVDDNHGRMRCEGNRCAALIGEVGMSTSCSIYAVRPQVCRVCLPGDEACQQARRLFGL
jgi:uncharacterized protein